MADRISALYVSDEMAGRPDEGRDWQRLTLRRRVQLAERNVHLTMVWADERTVYLLEGERAAVTALLDVVTAGRDDPGALVLIDRAMPRWGARHGRLVMPALRNEEAEWLSTKLDNLVDHVIEVHACLIWASMRTRETILADFGSPRPRHDIFPPAVRLARQWPAANDQGRSLDLNAD